MDFNHTIVVPAVTRTGSFNVDASLAGATVVVNSASAVTATVAADLPAGFAATFVQAGAGVVTFVPASGVTLRSLTANAVKSGGQWSLVSLLATGGGDVVVAGQTVA